MGAKSRKAQKVRVGAEFDLSRLRAAMKPPPEMASVYAWTLSAIMDARDAQIRGQFATPARLATAMRTDDALSVARAHRLAPQRCISVEVVPAKGARALSIAGEGESLFGDAGVAISAGTRADVNGCLVDHGVAFAFNTWTPRDDGSRIDVEVRYWPIEHVRWDALRRCYVTRVDPSCAPPPADAAVDAGGGAWGGEVPIVHGDGRWIVFSAFDHEPHKQEPAVMPGALVWARHAYAIRDWAKGSIAHGSAKVIGKLPEGTALQDAGGMTAEAAAFAELLRAVASSDSPVGIAPAGSTVDFLTNTSTAWQVWTQLVENAERAAARVYLGTDGILGSVGGAPGFDVEALFGVALTKVQGDLDAITRAIATGAIEPWAAINFGDSALAPTRRYMLPDADADAERASRATRRQAFYADIGAARQAGAVIDQAFVDAVATVHNVDAFVLKVAPVADAAPAATPPAALRAVQ